MCLVDVWAHHGSPAPHIPSVPAWASFCSVEAVLGRDALHISHPLHALSLGTWCGYKEKVDDRPGCSSARTAPPAGKVLPLEILPLGEFDPVYRSTLDVQNGELPVLPLSIYGAVGGTPYLPTSSAVLLLNLHHSLH